MDKNALFYYTKDTKKAITSLVEEHPELEERVLEIAELAHADGAENATNGYGYPVYAEWQK